MFRHLRHLAAITLFLIPGGLATAQQTQSYTLSGERVAVYNLAGVVRIEAGKSGAVVVDVTRHGADADKLSVRTGPVRDTEALRVIYPEDRIIYPELGAGSSTEFTIGEDGTWGHRGDDDRRIVVRGQGRGLEASADLRIQLPPGKRLAVYLGVGQANLINVDGDVSLDLASAPVHAESVRGMLRIDTGSGEVTVKNGAGSLHVETGSGDVEVSEFKGELVKVETGSGSVTASALEAPKLDLETGSGRIDLKDARSPEIVLDSGSGEITAVVLEDIRRLSVETGSGDVSLTLPEKLGAQLRIETGSGGIDVDFPIQLIRKDESTLTASIGDGEGRIDIETGSGEVVLKK